MDHDADKQDKGGKRERFVKVAERRTIRVIKDVQLLARCAIRTSYDYGPADIEHIFKTIDDELTRAKAAFTKERGVNFSLPSEEGADDVNRG